MANTSLEKLLKSNKAVDPIEFYSHLEVKKHYRFTLWIVIGVMLFLVTNAIYFNIWYQKPWITILFPVVSICIFLLLIPPSEEWAYKPWQHSAQKVEHYFFD